MEIQNLNLTTRLQSVRNFFDTGQTRSLDYRLKALDKLENLIRENQDSICAALYSDMRKPVHESMISEIAFLLEEIKYTKKKLRGWLKPKSVGTPMNLWPGQSRVHFEPLGVVLIIGPWNYPFQLTLAPLVGAIAAGNCAVVKPSELTPKTSRLIAELVQTYFKKDYICTIEGGVPETTALIHEKFDHIFFTGSTPVGKIIMQAAAQNLIPVTLELGGKSPAVVCKDADLDLAARRIVWGKFYNLGQTCVAPDYLYVEESVREELLEKLQTNISAQFGNDPQKSKDLSRIVNQKNFNRLVRLLEGEKIVCGGEKDEDDLYIAPTLLGDVSLEAPVMQEEIFGPILPVLNFKKISDVFANLRRSPKPLAAYLFTRSKRTQSDFIDKVTFGGGSINDTLVHLGNPALPFGGVGDSGMGRYHGKTSFETFTHAKSVISRSGFLDFKARYAPYTDQKLKFLKKIFGL